MLMLTAFLLTACGGGGGGGGGGLGSSGLSTPASTGSVTVLMTDAPTDDFSEILLTVIKVELFSDNGKVTIFEGHEVIDLLELENVSEIFAVDPDVPAGCYSKIRMTLEDLELVRKDEDGNVIETAHPHIPGNGKLDLNFRGVVCVEANSALIVEIDMDAKNAIHVVGTGSGKYQFRPVVFVNVVDEEFSGKLVRLSGSIENLSVDYDQFDLCGTHAVNLRDDDDGRDDEEERDEDHDEDSDEEEDEGLDDESDDNEESSGEEEDTDSGNSGNHGNGNNKGNKAKKPASTHNEGGDLNGCVEIRVDEDTSIFGNDGMPADPFTLENGNPATVIGHLREHHGANEDDHLVMDAEVIELGESGTFASIAGVVQSGVDAQEQFVLAIEEGQGFAPDSDVTVQLQTGTKIFSRAGDELTDNDIVPFIPATVDGVLEVSPTLLLASLVVLDTDAADQERLCGTLVLTGSDLVLQPDVDGCVTGDRCILTDADTEILRVIATDTVGSSIPSSPEEVSGLHADVFGSENGGGCLEAATIIAYDYGT